MGGYGVEGCGGSWGCGDGEGIEALFHAHELVLEVADDHKMVYFFSHRGRGSRSGFGVRAGVAGVKSVRGL